MGRRGGWTRVGSPKHFRYLDARGNRITDPEKLARIQALVIPPAWRDVWISSRPNAPLQATGVDAAGRKQYLYHPDFRARQEQAKFDRLIRFAEKLPELREAMARHMELEGLERERVAAVAVRLINLGWFRVGSERYAKEHKTFGITTLTKRHVRVRGTRIAFEYRGKHKIWVRTTLVDDELAGRFWPLLEAEHARVVARLLAIPEAETLLENAPALRERLSHRNHWVDPLSHVQVALLARSRAGDATVGAALMATITGIAAGLRNTG